MRHVDRKTLAASIAANLTYNRLGELQSLEWGRDDIYKVLDELTSSESTDKIWAIDKRLRAGGTAYKWAMWSKKVDNPKALRTLICNFAMEQRPKEASRAHR